MRPIAPGPLIAPAFLVWLCACACNPAPPATGPYLQRATKDAVTIAWTTQAPSVGEVEWSVDEGPQQVSREEAAGTTHAVALGDLPPGSTIRYRHLPEERPIESKWREYQVPGADEERVHILVLGDSGTGSATQRSVADALLEWTEQEGPFDAFLHVGDIAYESGTRTEFIYRFFHVYEEILAQTPFWPALGNHEARSVDVETEEGPWFDFFVLPTEGEAGGVPSGTERWYAFELGPVHFVSLDTSTASLEPDDPMLTWLEADLGAHDRPWTIAFFHHPPYTGGTVDDDGGARLQEVRERIVPILERHGVDLVIAGHSHIYERSALIAGAHGTSISEDAILDRTSPYEKRPGPGGGTVYLVAGHGGYPTNGPLGHPLAVHASLAHGFLVIDVESDERLRVRNVLEDGTVDDSFELIRRP